MSELPCDSSTLDWWSDIEFCRDDERVSAFVRLRGLSTRSSSSFGVEVDGSSVLRGFCSTSRASSSSTNQPSPSTSQPPATPIPSTSTVTRRKGCFPESTVFGGEIGGDRKIKSLIRVVAVLAVTVSPDSLPRRVSFGSASTGSVEITSFCNSDDPRVRRFPKARQAPEERCGGRAAVV
jgi:hypothetical protein